MFNYFEKRAVKKKATWLAKKESQIALTAIATVVTQDLVRRLFKRVKKEV